MENVTHLMYMSLKIKTMSNNKQSMKLYTEKQVIYAIRIAFDIEPPIKVKDILRELTPIELPSDEEIRKEAEKYACSETTDLDTDYARNIFEGQKDGFEQGLKFMRDKIGGNK